MKRFIIFILSLIIAGSCSKDLLDKAPVDTLNPSIFWETQADALAAVNNLYTHLPDARTTLYREMLSDFAIGNSGNDGRNNVLEGTVDASSGIFSNYWRSYYVRIAATNYFLANVDKVKSINAELLERIKAEARFIRSYAYLELAMDFGDVPLVTKPLTVSEGANIKRTPRFEVFQFVISEMDEITDKLPLYSQQIASGEVGRVTQGAALALKARAGLFAGSVAQNFGGADPGEFYTKTVEACSQIINSAQYGLYPDFSKLFSYDAEYSNEIILSRVYMKDVLPHSTFTNNAPQILSTSPYIDINITKSLVNQFQMQSTGLPTSSTGSGWDPTDPYLGLDPRLEATTFLPAYDDDSYCSVIDEKRWDVRPGLPGSLRVRDVINQTGESTKTGFALKKYINPEQDRNQKGNDGTNIILIRYADVLLMYAEALIELNQDPALAQNLINQVRTRAQMPELLNSGFSESDLLDQAILREIVRRERTVELAMEGLRFYDIRRWKIAENLIGGPVEGMTYIDYKTKEETIFYWVARIRNFNPERDYLFPVPTSEIIINPGLLPNNPNW